MKTSTEGRSRRVCIVVLPHASAASIYCAHDDLSAVGRLDRGFGLASSFARAPFDVRTVGVTTEPMAGAAGILLCPQKAVDEVAACDIVFIVRRAWRVGQRSPLLERTGTRKRFGK